MHRRLAVLGHPIEHSLSPILHAAAYQHLGLGWSYERHDLLENELAGFLDGCDRSWRGLSVTMPLKSELVRCADRVDAATSLTGVGNTLLFDDGERIVANTDVVGVDRSLRNAGLDSADHALIFGAGATARSVLVALNEFGLSSAVVAVRDPHRAGGMVELAGTLGLELDVVRIDDVAELTDGADVVAWTLPNGVALESSIDVETRMNAVALDVTYHPWPGPLAAQWLEVGGRVASGRDMLVNQAVRQVRIFVSGQAEEPLDDESEIEAVMFAALSAEGRYRS